MRFFLQLPIVGRLHTKHLLFPVIVLLAVAGVLAHGALNGEAPAEEVPAPAAAAPVRATFPTLRPDLEKTPLTYVADYWLQLADHARTKLVLLGEERTPGIMIAPGLALTSIRAAHDARASEEQRRIAQPGDREPEIAAEKVETALGTPPLASDDRSKPEPPISPYRVLAVDSALELALFEVQETSAHPAFVTVDPATMASGSYVAAVTLGPDHTPRITPGYLVSAQPIADSGREDLAQGSLDLSMVLSSSTRVAAIVDLDGALVGAAIESSDGLRVLPSTELMRIATGLQENRACYSIEVAELTETVRTLLGLRDGVAVEKVRPESFTSEPSLRAGDVLVEWDGERVSSIEEFERRYQEQEPGSRVGYVVRRGRRRISGDMIMPGSDCRPVGEPFVPFPRLGLTLQWSAGSNRPGSATGIQGWQVIAVEPNSPAARGGLERDDRIIAVDGQYATSQNARRALNGLERRPREALLTVQRDDRVTLLAISPGGE